MIKFVVAALWITAITVASVFFSFQQTHETAMAEPAPPYFGGLDYVKTEVMSVPVLENGVIDGYFLARLVYTVEPEKLKKLSLPAESLIIDEVYSYLFDNPQINFVKVGEIDLDALRAGIRESVNERVGEEFIHEVLVEQVDFLTKDDIRDNQMRVRTPQG